jgi:hypothetical protein
MHKYFLIVAICAAMGATQVASSALATPTAAPLPAAVLKTVPCKELANGAPHCKLPDQTAGPTITVGGHVVTWGGHVTLTDADVMPSLDGTKKFCYFTISYVLKNVGLGNAGPPATSTFKNEIMMDGVESNLVVGRQSLLSLAAATSLPIHTSIYLPSPTGELDLVIDAGGNAVVASDAINRNVFFITYTITSSCKDLATWPVVF